MNRSVLAVGVSVALAVAGAVALPSASSAPAVAAILAPEVAGTIEPTRVLDQRFGQLLEMFVFWGVK